MIVVDTNIICYRWLPSPRSLAVEEALLRDSDWIAPFLWRSEFRNALAGALRQRVISMEVALEAVQKAEDALAGREFEVSSHTVLSLVAASRCSAYDCEFIALAQEHQVILVTEDRDMLREFPAIALSLDSFLRR